MRGEARVTAQLARLPEADTCYISVVTNGEIRYGIRRMPPGQKRRSVERAYELLLPHVGGMLDLTRAVSETFAHLKATLEQTGIVLPENDLWIAATALEGHLTLVSDDQHFAVIPGLSLANWHREDES